MNKTTLRPAIAMVELIFAIVIMGIVLMSAPMLISTASKSGYVAIQQEAINEAASQVNMIMGYHWDENNTNEDYIPPILEVSSSGDTALNEVNISAVPTGRRLGTPKESYRAFIRADGQRLRTSASLQSETGETEEDDIDDFDGTTTHLVLIPEATLNADNIETTTIDINRTVSYSDDNASYNTSSITYNPFTTGSGTTNIKSISVTLTSTSGVDELDKEIILRAFSCNIGGYKLEERDF
jgi:hypothetical protein